MLQQEDVLREWLLLLLERDDICGWVTIIQDIEAEKDKGNQARTVDSNQVCDSIDYTYNPFANPYPIPDITIKTPRERLSHYLNIIST